MSDTQCSEFCSPYAAPSDLRDRIAKGGSNEDGLRPASGYGGASSVALKFLKGQETLRHASLKER